ncbi:MAG: hypothetical protein JRN68_04395 [Nitrososphaerota archaeon]|nr:hypothetical protein [Ferrimicrobium acidiphilum]MDG6933916.1 hypothetical protein [Nitrososphaerota archaeon]
MPAKKKRWCPKCAKDSKWSAFATKGSFFVRTCVLSTGEKVGYRTHSFYDKSRVYHQHSMGERADPSYSVRASTIKVTTKELNAIKDAHAAASKGSALETGLAKVTAALQVGSGA